MNNENVKMLLGHHGLRGDLAINLPAIEYLHIKYGCTIDMPIHKQFAEMAPLFLNHPSLNSIIITDEYEKFPNEIDQKILMERGYTHITNPMKRHKQDDWWNYMHQTSAVLFDYSDGIETLSPEQQQINLVKWFPITENKKMIAFAPFAGFVYNKANDKMLTIEKAQAIVNYIISKGFEVLQLGASNEPSLVNARLNINPSYFQSVQDMLGCRALIHTDTGMGWICSGYKHRQLGLYGHRYYGKANVKNIQPINPNGTYLDADLVNNIPNEEIFAAIDNLLQ
jgi:hypothetical protein